MLPIVLFQVLASLMLLFLLLGLFDWGFDFEPSEHEHESAGLTPEELNMTIKDSLVDSVAMERLQRMSPSCKHFITCLRAVYLP